MPPHVVPGIIKCYGNSSGNIRLSPCFVDLYEMRVFNPKYSYVYNSTDERTRLSVVLGTDPAGEELPVIDVDNKEDATTLTLTSSTRFTGFPAIATSTIRTLLFAR